MLRIAQEALTFDDVLLLPGYSEVVATDVSCLMHLEGLIRREQSDLQVLHIAEVLARF